MDAADPMYASRRSPVYNSRGMVASSQYYVRDGRDSTPCDCCACACAWSCTWWTTHPQMSPTGVASGAFDPKGRWKRRRRCNRYGSCTCRCACCVVRASLIIRALSVTEPCSTGIGGDCFMLFYQHSSRAVFSLNGSGRAPAALTLDMVRSVFPDAGVTAIPHHSALAVTVPGTSTYR
jgi:hypothetical protein